MVQSVESPADSFSLFQLGGAARTPWAKSADSAVFAMTSQSGESSSASPDAGTSFFDTGQTTSGDYATVFQRLSTGLQALMVQLQSIAGNGGTSSDPPAVETAIADPPATGGFHASGGNRALQSDADAMINDLHGFIQVANGDFFVDGVAVSPVAAASGATANDNATPVASGDVAGSAFGQMSYGYAQAMMRAVRNYSAASAEASGSRPSAAISAVG
ncbi:hypothetical protein [Telmatospirillum siberiense]|nr:hypothetical protein [Telmatospirillum siberiense]